MHASTFYGTQPPVLPMYGPPLIAEQNWSDSFENWFNSVAQNYSDSVTQQINDFIAAPSGVIARWVVGMGLGACMNGICVPLIKYTLNFFEIIIPEIPFSASTVSPFALLNICVIGPIIEELGFRVFLQDALNDGLTSFYLFLGLSNPNANIAARITSIFFTSIVFGLLHFTNALFLACNPMIFLPQVIGAIIIGVVLGLAKELTGGLSMPIGMHMGNNIFACAQWLYFH